MAGPFFLAIVFGGSIAIRFLDVTCSPSARTKHCTGSAEWNVPLVKISVYTLAGLFVGIAGMYQFALSVLRRSDVGNRQWSCRSSPPL